MDGFETTDAGMRGEMMVTFTLTDARGGTDVLAVHDNLPPGLSPADNETGWRTRQTRGVRRSGQRLTVLKMRESPLR